MEDIELDPPKVVKYGRAVSDRLKQQPILHQQQKDALESLAKCFSEDHEKKGQKTKDYTAVVSICLLHGTGKSGIICCLPYYLGGANLSCIDFSKPILAIAPGLDIFLQLKESLLTNPFLKMFGLLKEKD